MRRLEEQLEEKRRAHRETEFILKESEKDWELQLEKLENEHKLQSRELLAEWEERSIFISYKLYHCHIFI